MLKVVEMTEEYARIISTWTYPKPYEMYNMKNNREEVEEIMNGLHVAVTDVCKNELIGFGAFGWSAQVVCEDSEELYQDESYTDVAYGLAPDLCGKGLGKSLVKCVNAYIKELFPEDGLRLTVCKDNIRAIKVYTEVGFRPEFDFTKDGLEFVAMIL